MLERHLADHGHLRRILPSLGKLLPGHGHPHRARPRPGRLPPRRRGEEIKEPHPETLRFGADEVLHHHIQRHKQHGLEGRFYTIRPLLRSPEFGDRQCHLGGVFLGHMVYYSLHYGSVLLEGVEEYHVAALLHRARF